MPSVFDFPARGKVVEVAGNAIVFQPTGTTYRIDLLSSGGEYDGPINMPVSGVIRARARKIWTVPSGGNFVEPIYGRPRIVQGRVRYADEKMLVILAAAPVAIELPVEDTSFDLSNGAISVGSLVNAVVQAGATFELIGSPVAR